MGLFWFVLGEVREVVICFIFCFVFFFGGGGVVCRAFGFFRAFLGLAFLVIFLMPYARS